MTEKEQSFVTGGDTRFWYVKQEEYDRENSFIAYSSVTIKNDVPVSFLDVFVKDGIGEIAVGVRKYYRHKGYASREVENLLRWYNKNKQIKKLSWCVNKNNKRSVALARKFGFFRDESNDFDDVWIAYAMK